MTKTYDENEPINIGRFLADHGAKPKPSEAPFIMRDYYASTLAYESPLTGKTINSRSERQKEMKEHNVREVDPSESPFHREGDRTIKAKNAKKAGIDPKWAK